MSNEDLMERIGQSQEETEFYTPMPDGYRPGRTKYVMVVGTVMSGLGKGIFSSSLAKLLQDKGLKVAPIKMEGYYNIDSGTLNPYRHGEVFVLDDGMETDMDLGTYERLLDQDLSAANFTTNGQIFSAVLKKEREGGYLGRDVQTIPHVTGEVKLKLRELAVKSNADVVFVEVGGTVGDYENAVYLEACRQLAYEEGEGAACFVALTYVLEPGALGEQKSKAAQLGIKRLMEMGIMPSIVACRAANPVGEKVRRKSPCIPTCRCAACFPCTTWKASTWSPRPCARPALIAKFSPFSICTTASISATKISSARSGAGLSSASARPATKSPSPSLANTPRSATPTPASSRPASIAAPTSIPK